jgi:hypothetical protein
MSIVDFYRRPQSCDRDRDQHNAFAEQLVIFPLV